MNRFASLMLLACVAAMSAAPPAAHAQGGPYPYVLRDTTGLPPPSAGKALLVVSRERMLSQGLKPEFVVVDWEPFGQLPPRSAVAGEITPGWHRLWLGRGANASAEMWFEAVEGERYLVRLREALLDGAWIADLIRESRGQYIDFAKQQGMKLSVTTENGYGAIQRDLEKLKKKAKPDSVARAKAQTGSQLPIVVKEAWYLDVAVEDPIASTYDTHPGTLTVDANALRYTRADTTVLEIPRSSITLLRYGSIKGNRVNPWLNVYYMVDGIERGASFVDPIQTPGAATATYNRVFAELEKTTANK